MKKYEVVIDGEISYATAKTIETCLNHVAGFISTFREYGRELSIDQIRSIPTTQVVLNSHDGRYPTLIEKIDPYTWQIEKTSNSGLYRGPLIELRKARGV